MISVSQAVVLQWIVIVTNKKSVMYAEVYLRSPSKPCHSVPCCNKQCGWSEVARRWKQLLQLTTSSLEKGDIRCLPVENVSKSSDIHIIPEWSNQWSKDRRKIFLQWKPLRYEFEKWESKWNNSICVYLWSNSVAVIIITSQTFISGATKISYYVHRSS